MSTTGDTLLQADRLSLEVAGRQLCGELSIMLRGGENLVVLGPNGAGKTTLLNALAGLGGQHGGQVRLAGRGYAERTPRENARIRALLPQDQSDHFSATALEAVLVGRHPHLGRWAWESARDLEIAHQCLQAVDMDHMAGRDTLSLSGGERQRVALAALLAQQTPLLLLDEPLNHLDLHHQISVLELMRSLTADGQAVVMVLHDINLAARYADKVVLLDGAGGCMAGAASQVLDEAILSRVFGHPLRQYLVGGHRSFIPL